MSEMVERVAKALHAVIYDPGKTVISDHSEYLDSFRMAQCRRLTDVTFAAMREPNEAVVERITRAVLEAMRAQGQLVSDISDVDDGPLIFEGQTHTTIDGTFDMAKVSRAVVAAIFED